jgi:hypothetical protein
MKASLTVVNRTEKPTLKDAEKASSKDTEKLCTKDDDMINH